MRARHPALLTHFHSLLSSTSFYTRKRLIKSKQRQFLFTGAKCWWFFMIWLQILQITVVSFQTCVGFFYHLFWQILHALRAYPPHAAQEACRKYQAIYKMFGLALWLIILNFWNSLQEWTQPFACTRMQVTFNISSITGVFSWLLHYLHYIY